MRTFNGSKSSWTRRKPDCNTVWLLALFVGFAPFTFGPFLFASLLIGRPFLTSGLALLSGQGGSGGSNLDGGRGGGLVRLRDRSRCRRWDRRFRNVRCRLSRRGSCYNGAFCDRFLRGWSVFRFHDAIRNGIGKRKSLRCFGHRSRFGSLLAPTAAQACCQQQA